jgi:hypothetical protein
MTSALIFRYILKNAAAFHDTALSNYRSPADFPGMIASELASE